MGKLINLFRKKRTKKIQEGDMVYSRVSLDKFNNFHLFKVIKMGELSADLESNGIVVKDVNLENLKKSEIFNNN